MYQVALLTNLAMNFFARPDFIAYKFRDRSNRVLRRNVDKKGITEASWTIRSKQAYDDAIKAGCIPIFEQIKPEELGLEKKKNSD